MGTAASQFSSSTTAEEVVQAYSANLSYKTVFVTGATAGIGLETARVLLLAGATVFVGCRSEDKAQVLCESLKQNLSESSSNYKNVAQVIPVVMDQSSLQSVQQGIQQFRSHPIIQQRGLDLLILNAGVMIYFEKKLSQDNFELQFAVNHLSHFLITLSLLPELKKQPASSTDSSELSYSSLKEEARIVIVSSAAHKMGNLQMDDYNFEKRSISTTAYGDSKAYNILFSNYINSILQRDFENHSNGENTVRVTSNSLHPGVIATELARNSSVTNFFFKHMAPKSIPQGAATTVYVALSPELKGHGGQYFSDCALVQPYSTVTDVDTQKKLWTLSLSLLSSYLDPALIPAEVSA
eukprot:TRINITY_DN17_c0_g1_i1.p1 TRINITY_DN17_c0_g1~~TRINITY_DN17_c0_g1_i1.p1  ORF type:complete len:362 (-),score=107.20 TRINITY_DN17_c0_g1_i1:136-1194(-)